MVRLVCWNEGEAAEKADTEQEEVVSILKTQCLVMIEKLTM